MPLPTTVLIVPAAMPAAKMASASSMEAASYGRPLRSRVTARAVAATRARARSPLLLAAAILLVTLNLRLVITASRRCSTTCATRCTSRGRAPAF